MGKADGDDDGLNGCRSPLFVASSDRMTIAFMNQAVRVRTVSLNSALYSAPVRFPLI